MDVHFDVGGWWGFRVHMANVCRLHVCGHRLRGRKGTVGRNTWQVFQRLLGVTGTQKGCPHSGYVAVSSVLLEGCLSGKPAAGEPSPPPVCFVPHCYGLQGPDVWIKRNPRDLPPHPTPDWVSSPREFSESRSEAKPLQQSPPRAADKLLLQ